ncbi:MAG TPA: hypothetical protein VFH59_04700 [Frateuria sp.]|uniref:hypothetical protein n=1 Tax=Frateuria sp. TaxID=2211372 RepID=UPI002D7FB722|nr:hypothetical protein [Frateuria sp.]HET6804725.1 hypothetical protein [Frateuria sp.]
MIIEPAAHRRGVPAGFGAPPGLNRTRRPVADNPPGSEQQMAIRRLIGGILLLSASCAWAGTALIAIRSPHELAAATRVNRDIGEVAQAVGRCAASSPPATCACRFPAALERLKASYAAAVRQFPAWRGRMITWQDPASGQTVVLAFDGLEQQLQASCPDAPRPG